ncbi:peptidylprolyl isomerase, partial [candidate division KSB1 bacterium]|nr:peptidylprolyl isomerase [candidate division KSB1 bacterium]
KRKIAFVTFSTQPSKEDSALVVENVNDLLERAKGGEDFAKLAKDNSEDGSAQNGGDLGYFGRGNMIKPFEEAAFGANVGDIVGPVYTQFGIHIIKVEDKKTENNEEKVKASHILLKYKASDETVRLAVKKARYIADRAKAEPFEIVVKQENLQVDSTDFFEAGGFIPKIGQSLNASRYLFKNVIGTVSHPFRYRGGYFVFKIIDGQDERFKTLEEAKAEITNKLKREKQFDLVGEVCKSFRDKMQGMSLAEAAMRDSLKVTEPRPFARKDYVEGSVGRDAAFIGSALGLENGEISGPVKGVRGYYLIEMVEKKALDEQDLDIKTEQLRAEIMRQKQQRAYTEWFTKLKDEARIKDYRDRYL